MSCLLTVHVKSAHTTNNPNHTLRKTSHAQFKLGKIKSSFSSYTPHFKTIFLGGVQEPGKVLDQKIKIKVVARAESHLDRVNAVLGGGVCVQQAPQHLPYDGDLAQRAFAHFHLGRHFHAGDFTGLLQQNPWKEKH